MNLKVGNFWFGSFLFFLIIVFFLNLFMFAFPKTDQSYSLWQQYQEYQGINNWNLPLYADGLFDADSEIDLVFNNGCAYLTQAKDELHGESCQPMNPGFRQGTEGKLIGGQLVMPENFEAWRSFSVYHSFIAKKPNENWKVYEQVNGLVRAHELMPEGRVVRSSPSMSDRIDAAWYFVTHLFVIIM